MNMEMILGLVRHLLTFGGGFLVAKGYLDDATLNTLLAAAITLIGGGWSLFQKSRQQKAVATALMTPPPK